MEARALVVDVQDPVAELDDIPFGGNDPFKQILARLDGAVHKHGIADAGCAYFNRVNPVPGPVIRVHGIVRYGETGKDQSAGNKAPEYAGNGENEPEKARKTVWRSPVVDVHEESPENFLEVCGGGHYFQEEKCLIIASKTGLLIRSYPSSRGAPCPSRPR